MMTVLTVPDDKGKWYPSLGGQVCEFIEENLVFGPGDLRGLPAKLDNDKKALIWRMYEVYPEGHAVAGRRRFKRVGISLAKGLAKTELAAWIAACELHPEAPVRCMGFNKKGKPIGGPVKDPYIPMVAYTEEQSDELCYGTLKVILEEGPLAKDFDIGMERIMRKRGDGKVVSLSSSPNARDGARTTFSVMDETHWWTLPRLQQAHQTMMANLPKRKEADAWGLEVTTAPEPGAGSVAEKTMEYAQAVKEGRIRDSRLFYYHRQAGDEHLLDTSEDVRAAVIEASGMAASWRDIDAIVELWRDPTTDRAYFDRVYCNRLVKASLKAFDVEEWKPLIKEKYQVEKGSLITLGFDGAMFHDAVGLVGTEIETGYQFVLGLWECPYGKKDWQAPVDEIEDAVTAAFENYDVWRMYADPQYWLSYTAKWAGLYGKEKVIEWYTNKYNQMCYSIEAYETAIKSKELSHDGNIALTRHIVNAFKHEMNKRDEQGKRLWVIKKERGDSPNKIDLAMAAILSWRARLDAVALGATGGPSIYEDRGVLAL
jgi:phage terminase large subunit-like protein